MLIHCSKCNTHAFNACPKELVMKTKKIIKRKSRYANCMAIRLFSDKIEDKDEIEFIYNF